MLGYCHVVTWYGSALCVDADSGRVIAERAAADVIRRPLLAIVSDCGSDIALFAAAGASAMPIAFGPRDYRNILVPMRVRPLAQDGRVAFLHPVTNRFLMAVAEDAPVRAGEVLIESTLIREWEKFRLRPVEGQLAPLTEAAALAIEPLLRQTISPASIVAWLERASGSAASAVVNAAWPLLTLHELDGLAKQLFNNPVLLARLFALFPDDVWATSGLPALGGWIAMRGLGAPPPRKRQLGPALDFLAEAGYYGSFASFPHACNAYARAAVEPSQNVCIVATARNEGIYLLDWLAYHRAIGIDAFFVYSNDNIDGCDALLSVLAEAGVISWIDNKVGDAGYPRPKAYAHAFGLLPDVLDYRWALVIDLDEFLVLNPDVFGSVGDFLHVHEMRQTDAIALNWVMVGPGREGVWRDEPVTRRFRRLFPASDHHIKTMCRPRRFIHSRPHFPVTDHRRAFVWRHSSGDLHVYPERPGDADHAPAFSWQPNTDYAAVYHYFYKSAEEFLWKFARNRADLPYSPALTNGTLEAHFVRRFMQQRETDHFVIDDRIERCAPTFDAELAKLMALPGVRAANEHVQQNFRNLIEQVKPAFRTSPAILEAGEVGARFLQVAGVSE